MVYKILSCEESRSIYDSLGTNFFRLNSFFLGEKGIEIYRTFPDIASKFSRLAQEHREGAKKRQMTRDEITENDSANNDNHKKRLKRDVQVKGELTDLANLADAVISSAQEHERTGL